MNHPAKFLLICVCLLAVSACGKKETSTPKGKLDTVEVQEGTISDHMITLDQIATDGTAIDSSTPVDTSRKAAPKPVEAPTEEAATPAAAAVVSTAASTASSATTN